MNELTTTNAFQPPMLMQQGIESAATAVASQAKAMVEARYTIAMHRPRNWEQVRQDLLRECRRPSFANNKSAYYRKPIGQGVEGLGIRFVEVALRCMTNVLIETTMIFEDAGKEVHRVSVTDLESNITYPMDVRVSKTVERAKSADDGSYISVRTNSYGKKTYTVPANDDDLLNKRAALISKAIRTLGLRIVPGDLCDEAEEIIKRVRMDEAAKDPGAEGKRIADAFLGLGIKAGQLAEYLGHDIGSCSPKELVDLRGLFGAIKDGEATWASVMENKAEQVSSEKPIAPAAMTEDYFSKNKEAWARTIQAGKKTPDQIIAMVSTKGTLSEAQKQAIRDMAQPTTSSVPPAPASDAPPVTYAQVAGQLREAQDMDDLAVAGSLISAVADAQQKQELSTIYDQRAAALNQ